MHAFRHLRVWQEAVALAGEVFRAAGGLPRDYSPIAHQMRAAARSVHANIAEGSGSTSSRDLLRFLRYSAKSLRELESDVIALRRSSLIPAPIGITLSTRIGRVERLLLGLIRHISDSSS